MKEQSHMRIRQMVDRYDSMRTIMLVEGILVGIAAGLVSVLYRFALGKADEWRNAVLHFCQGNGLRMAGWFVLLVLMAYLVARLNRWEPMISGSGIPQVEAEIVGYIRPNWWKVISAKVVGGFLCIVGGLSLGREGPSIQLGGMAGKGVSKLLKRFRLEEHFLITCGASAGLAAAFNAPMAGVMFALEEVHKNFSAMIMLSCMSAALIADYIANGIFGMEPVFSFPVEGMIPLHYYPVILVLGLLCGLLGVLYNKVLLASQTAYKKLNFLPDWGKLTIPFLCAGVLGFTMPVVLGGGHEMIVELYDGQLVLGGILALLIVKFLYSMVSFGSGAPGGIFFPLLVLGAYIGSAYGVILVSHGMLQDEFLFNVIIISMAALFSSIVRAPVTGVVLISEMTGSFSHLLSLATASLVAYIVADLLGSKPVYESLTERLLLNKNVKVEKGRSGKNTILTCVVEAGSEADGCRIRNLCLPSRWCLVISVTRGEEDLIPRGDLRLRAGDTLVTLVKEQDMLAMESVMRHKVELDEEHLEGQRS
ncbi:MAG: ClC family H(+)/Cl(-) exchange transporter [Eubacteriales bacterium]|nr:ClC family H(+)/Cl(-) exchange transporter [Eubacteriales bacterium]